MGKYENTEKEPRRKGRGGVVVLVVFLLLLGMIGYLYYSVVKAPLELDDPWKLAESKPMLPQERFSFFSADAAAQIKMDEADLWSLVIAHGGADFMDRINEQLNSYNLTLSGCAMGIDQDGVQLDMEIFYEDIRLVVKIPCSLEISGTRFKLKPAGMKIGAISLPVKKLLDSLNLEYEIKLPVISCVEHISYEENALVLTGSVEQDLASLVPEMEKLYQTAVFSNSMQTIADYLITHDGYDALLSHLERDPGSVEDLYRNLFTLADSETTDLYLNERYGLTQRFFPGIDFAAVADDHTAITGEAEMYFRTLEQFFTETVNIYNDKEFRLSNGEFLYKKKPFHPGQIGNGKYDTLYEVLNPDSFFLVLVDAEDGFIRKTSSFYRMASEGLEFTREVDYNKTYILGCVIYSVDGEPFLLYETESGTDTVYVRNVTLRPLTQEAAEELRVPGKFGVWIG